IINGQFDASDAQIGDTICAFVSPDTVVGALTANVTIGDTVINVSPTVTANMSMGFFVDLWDGVNTEPLGEVEAIDVAGGTITVSTASTQAFAAVSPTYVRLTVHIIDGMHINSAGQQDFAKKKLGGRSLPAGTLFRVIYINADGVEKNFVYNIEYLY
ncbi:unnamed protein product, partial [marine sediment metagenome]